MADSIATPRESFVLRALPDAGAARLAGMAIFAIIGTIVLWASAKVSVPFYPVPMTLQTLAIMVIAATYGSRLGAATLALYLIEGATGLPIFSGTPEKGIGIAYMVGPTGGYLVGFVVAAWLVGRGAEMGADKSVVRLFGVMLFGGVVITVFGFAWLAAKIGLEKAWQFGVVPFLAGDLLKIAIAALLVPAAGRLLKKG